MREKRKKKKTPISLFVEQQRKRAQMRVCTIPFNFLFTRTAREHTCGAYKTTFSSILFFRSRCLPDGREFYMRDRRCSGRVSLFFLSSFLVHT